jgi:hypothetical protein
MKAICYNNTKTTLPNWNPNDHLEQHCPMGYAYEIGDCFIHIYGSANDLYTISPCITVFGKRKEGETLRQWAIEHFGAVNIQDMVTDIGEVRTASWRPGLYTYDELQQALQYNASDIEDESQAMLLLFHKLSDIFQCVEPANENLKTYGHKFRELLILSCTEFENQSRRILNKWDYSCRGRDYTTQDYVALKDKCFLSEYEIGFKAYPDLKVFTPFSGWDSQKPTQSIAWYDSYNKTKHDRINNFSYANLEAVLNSIAANIILFCVRFGPYPLVNINSILSSYINQYIRIRLVNPNVTTFYVPLLEIKENLPDRLVYLDSYRNHWNKAWKHMKI